MEDQDIVPAVIGEERTVKKAEQKQQSIPFFNIFNFNQKQKLLDDSKHRLERKKGAKKQKVIRTKRENPPKFKYLSIKDHFSPKISDNSKIPNDSEEKLDQDPLE